MSPFLDDARAAVASGNWADALAALDADTENPTVEALELRAQAAYGNGEFEASIAAWEALHGRQIELGNQAEAARAAAMLAMYLMMDTGLMSPVRGWLQTAERLLEADDGRAPAHAVIAMVRTYERFMCGDMEAARHASESAIELGERLGVPPAVIIGRVANARVRIFTGDVEGGLSLLDEVGALLMGGGADPLTTGMMLCELICAAQGLAMYERAGEWTDLMERWGHGAAIGAIHGRCRVHRAEMLRLTGPCDAAEEEALGACDDLRPWMRREFGWPLAELGNIRLRRGDLDGAEEAFLAAHEHAWSPYPGLALLRLEQGDPDAAATLVADALANPVQVPSKERPPFGDLGTAPLLDAQSEIAAAMADVPTAETAGAGLRSIADAYPSRSLAANASLAEARAAILRGEYDVAIPVATAAIAGWAEIGAPFETAKARLVLAEAHEGGGNDTAAELERSSAARAFEAFGATRWARRAADPRAAITNTDAPGPGATGEPSGEFRLEGDSRIVTFDGRTVAIRDLKGFRYIERLLADPGREFHVLDLVAVEQGTLPTAGPVDAEAAAGTTPDGGGLPALDEQAKAAYRQRLIEVDQDIEDATAANDLGRLELAERDREYLLTELGRAIGLGGRLRSVGSDAERARTAVARSVRYALDRLAEHHPTAAMHIRRGLGTGTYCRYTADPAVPVVWIS